MDFHQLKIFLNAASLKSFSRAAERLYISQPSVSARIKSMEDELGAILFDRSRARELTLTEEGKLFIDYAQRMVNLHEEALQKLDRDIGPVAGAVQLGASTVPGIYLLPPLLAAFREAGTGIDINLAIMDTAQIIDKVLSYSVDLGFVGLMQQEDRLEYYPFASDRLIMIAPLGLLKPRCSGAGPGDERELSVEECLPFNLLVREKGSATRELFEKALDGKGLTLRDFGSVTYMDSLEAIKQGVRHGLGISPVSRHTAADYIRFGLVDAYWLWGFELDRALYLVRHRGRVLSRAASLVLNFIIEKAKNNSA